MAQLVKNPPAMQETPGFDSWVGTSAGEGIGYPLQYFGLENSMDCIAHGVAKNWTRLSDFTFTIYTNKPSHENFGSRTSALLFV